MNSDLRCEIRGRHLTDHQSLITVHFREAGL